MPTSHVLPVSLTLTTDPSWEQLHMWWAEMHSDPEDLRTAFSDFSSKDLEKFLCQDLLLVLVHSEESFIGAGWVHDLVRDVSGTPTEGWIGGWIAKPFRGRVGLASWKKSLRYFKQQGLAHIHSAINIENRHSFVFTKRQMGFSVVGIFPQFSQFGGVLTDVNILTLHPEDGNRAWRGAEVMAQQRWPERYELVPTHESAPTSVALASAG